MLKCKCEADGFWWCDAMDGECSKVLVSMCGELLLMRWLYTKWCQIRIRKCYQLFSKASVKDSLVLKSFEGLIFIIIACLKSTSFTSNSRFILFTSFNIMAKGGVSSEVIFRYLIRRWRSTRRAKIVLLPVFVLSSSSLAPLIFLYSTCYKVKFSS